MIQGPNNNLGPIVFHRGHKHVNLRPLDEGDLPLLLRWANDQNVQEFFVRCRPVSATAKRKWLEQKLSEESSETNLGITIAENGELVGMVSLHRVDLVHRTAWIGITIGRKDCWGHGYAPEAVLLLLDYAFNRLNLRKVCWGVLSSNKRSIRCAEKCGFKEEGRLLAQFCRNREMVDDVFMATYYETWLPVWREYCQNNF